MNLFYILTFVLFANQYADSAEISTRIVGGEDANISEFPYQVSLARNISETHIRHFCGGSILTPQWILTAGHCITEIPPSVIYVRAGITKQNEIGGQISRVILRVVHPKYPGGENPYDIALVKIETPFTFNDLVKPIRLPKAGQEFLGEAVFSGWGVLEFGSHFSPNHLQKVNVTIYKNTDCRKYLLAVNGTYEPFDDGMVCTGPIYGGLSPCSGDSGGPLVKSNFVVGVASWVVAPCGVLGAPAVYTKVSAYLDFINKHVY